MKKLIFLLLAFVTITTQAQTANGSETPVEGLLITNPQTVTATDFITTTGADGTQGRVLGENISLSVIPPVSHFTPLTPNIKGYFQGVDNAIGSIVTTTAGITSRIFFTGDPTTITAGTFFLSNPTGKGSVASASPTSLVNGDNIKQYFNKDVISAPFPQLTTYPAGTFGGQLSCRIDADIAQQRYTIEIYKTNNAGTPIASGITGAVTGSLGVTVISILDSGLVNIVAGNITGVPVTGTMASQLTLNTGERVRYHVSAEKVGTAGGNITMEVLYGYNYNSYYDVPITFDTNSVLNRSNVVGSTATDALNNLKTLSDSKLDENYVNNGYIAQNSPSSFSTSVYEAFPLMVRSQSNKILLFYRKATAHSLSKGAIQLRTSSDGGGTFTSDITVFTDATLDCRNLGGGVTASGRIIIYFSKISPATDIAVNQGYVYSDDDGVTWSTYTTIETNGNIFFSPYGKLINIGDGKIMQGWYGINGATYNNYVKISSDNGKTWAASILVATSTTILYNEASYVYLDGGIIIGLIRDANGMQFRQLKSLDNGATWADQGVITFDTTSIVSPELETYIDPNNNKYIVCFYANRADNKLKYISGSYSGLISGVSGWDIDTKTNLATHSISDFGYPSVVKSREGNKFLIAQYKATSSSLANILLTNFSPSANDINAIGKFNFSTGTSRMTVDIPNQKLGSVSLVNGSGANALPTIIGKSNDNGGLQIMGVTNDINTIGDLIFNVRENDGTDYTTLTSPAFSFRRFGTILMDIYRNGNILIPTLAGTGDRAIGADSTGKLIILGSQPKKYTALISQSGTSAPTATVLENTLGGTVVWTRTSTGIYVGTLTGAFAASKTVALMLCQGSFGLPVYRFTSPTTSTVSIETFTSNTAAFSDGLMAPARITIEVYP